MRGMCVPHDNLVPDGVDVAVPSAARVYDYLLGGAHNFAVDREMVDVHLAQYPVATELAVSNRAFLRRAVLAMMDAGIRQFLDLGSGIPTVGNVHEVAESYDMDHRVVYVDLDHVAVAHSELVLEGNDRARMLTADMTRVSDVLDSPIVEDFLDFTQPVGLLMVTVMHYVRDDTVARDVISRYQDALAPGSMMALTHLTADIRREEMEEAVRIMRTNGGESVVNRSRAGVTELFGDFELVEPGLVIAAQWRPDSGIPVPVGDELAPIYAGVGVKRSR